MRKVKIFAIWIIWLLLLIIEWLFDTIGALWKVLHDAVKDLALAMEKEVDKQKMVNEPDSAT